MSEYRYYCTDCRNTIQPGDRTCPHCGADTTDFVAEEDLLPSKRYPALRTIALIYQVFAGLVAVGTVVAAAIALTTDLGWAIRIAVLGLIGVITLLALSEGIKVFIDIEQNTRATVQLLQRQPK